MKEQIRYGQISPAAVQALRGVEAYVRGCSLDRTLIELMKVRASQLNGCAYCIDMHTKDARAAGETEQRLYALSAWREAPFYSERERIGLEWTEAVTRVGEGGVDDDLFARAAALFSELQLVELTMAVIAINGWNRMAVTFRPVVGSYRPGAHATVATEAVAPLTA
jgi:AhpD family alkylhydroperoxidase